jgi:hypothetical protein
MRCNIQGKKVPGLLFNIVFSKQYMVPEILLLSFLLLEMSDDGLILYD